jgi:hypothetical protein
MHLSCLLLLSLLSPFCLAGDYYTLYLYDDYDILCSDKVLFVSQQVWVDPTCTSYVWQPEITVKGKNITCPWISGSSSKKAIDFWTDAGTWCQVLGFELPARGNDCEAIPQGAKFDLGNGVVAGNYIINVTSD